MLHSSNAILASLSANDLSALQAHLRPVALKQKSVLHEVGDSIRSVYFPTSAVISMVVRLSTGETTEAAMVGRDGAVGLASAMAGHVAVCTSIVQLGGDAFACDHSAFRRTAMQSQTLIGIVMRHELTLFAQAQQSTACMANHEVEARLCRWLLRARELCGSDQLPFTQEFLAEMLGVRRTSVTTTARTLQTAGTIRYKRGRIEITDNEALKDSACECYETVKDRYRQLIIEADD
jgi:CRP-like cAMP-binding protein